MIDKLIKEATQVCGVMEFDTYDRNFSGKVGCALLTAKGNIFTGISIDLVCGLGNCAEYSAICEMLKNHETKIEMIVAVYDKKKIIPPCGRCRELISQLDSANMNTKVIMPDKSLKTLSELLPEKWN